MSACPAHLLLQAASAGVVISAAHCLCAFTNLQHWEDHAGVALSRSTCTYTVLPLMRPLTEQETKAVLEKLYKYIGKNIKNLIDRPDEPYCLRLHSNRVYYVRESLMRRATNVGREQLVSLGQCIGKLTHSGKFRLTIGALDVLGAHAKYKIWVKPSAEMQYMYGNHVMKSGLGRITENTPAYTGVVIYSMSDIPLGFGVTAKSTADCRKMDPSGIVVFHQADVGEYLRNEDEL